MKGLKARLLKKLQLIPIINPLRKGFAAFRSNNPQQQQQQQQQHQHHHQQQQQHHTDSNQNLQSTQQVQQDTNSNDQKGKQTDLDQSDKDNNNRPTPKIDPKDIETKPEHPSLNDFEEKCPPGGKDTVVLYTTSLRGVRKTFHYCSSVSHILSSFKVSVHERDVSMDMEFRDELWRLFGERVVPPKLFIKGRYIGGGDEIIGLHEQGILRKLLEGLPSNLPVTCSNCANMKFLVCPNCNGRRKVFAETEDEDEEELCLQCPDCNENGLVKCPNCC